MISIFILLICILFSGIVSASIRYDFDSALYGAEDVLRLLFGDVTGYGFASPGEVLFIKLLIWILLFAVINMILKKVPNFEDNLKVTGIVSLVVSLIAVRYMATAEIVNFVWLPYGVLGVTLTAFLPFVLGFFFIESFDSDILRKVGWTSYLVIFAGLAYTRWPDFAGESFNYGWIYIIVAVVSGILILFDKYIRALMLIGSMRKAGNLNARREIAKITNDIDELVTELARTTDAKLRGDLKKSIKSKRRTIQDIMKTKRL